MSPYIPFYAKGGCEPDEVDSYAESGFHHFEAFKAAIYSAISAEMADSWVYPDLRGKTVNLSMSEDGMSIEVELS